MITIAVKNCSEFELPQIPSFSLRIVVLLTPPTPSLANMSSNLYDIASFGATLFSVNK